MSDLLLVLVEHAAELILICDAFFKLVFADLEMFLELLQGREHGSCCHLELRDLHDLLLDCGIRDGADEREIPLDANQVLFGGHASQERKLTFDVCRLRTDEDVELFGLDEIGAASNLADEQVQ